LGFGSRHGASAGHVPALCVRSAVGLWQCSLAWRD
jgi:hypothetical protein